LSDERLRDYLLYDPAAEAPALPTPQSRARRLMSVVGVGRLRAISTAVLKPKARRRLAKLRESPELRLHLGSGFLSKDGWIDVDLAGAPADLVWNLKHGIPFETGTVDAIFHEHLLEHLTLQQGFQLTRECHRALKPGGVLRVAVPNAGACLRSYAGIDDPAWAQSRPTPMLAVQALFYEHGHHAMYDEQLLAEVLAAAGFVEAAAHEFGDSRLDPPPDTEVRRDGTLYVEGVKPPSTS
jgi:predicted SAM-dependent methyltransferase